MFRPTASLLALLVGLGGLGRLGAADAEPAPVAAPSSVLAAKPDAGPDLTWYRDSGFGMFLHWGAYAHLAGRWQGQERTKDLWGEWAMHRAKISLADYEAMARTFKPAAFDPAAWAAVAKDAGMGWMVLTAKHHDGFAMYRSKASAFNIGDLSGYPGDPVAELAAAARGAGLRYGVYYSHKIDWRHNPGGSADGFEAYYQSVCLPQVKELLTGYGPLDVLWFDIGVDQARATALRQLVHGLQPQTIISGRIGGDQGDFVCTGDCEVPVQPPAGAWETCMTLSEHWSWYPQDVYQKSAAEVVRMLAEVRGKGGCLLLNVGPDDQGRLPAREVAILRQVGAWMRTFGESLRGVTASPLAEVPWGFVTRAGNRLHLVLPEWPVSGRLIVPGIQGDIAKAWLVGDPARRPLAVERVNPQDLAITLDAGAAPLGAIDPLASVVAVELAPGATFSTVRCLDADWPNRLRPSWAQATPATKRKNLRTAEATDLDPAIEHPRYDDTADLAAPDSALTWTLRVPAAGDYHVLTDIACEGEPSGQVVAQLGPVQVAKPVRSGPWQDPQQRFLVQRLGTVSLPAADIMTMKLTVAGAAPGSRILVKGLTLVPTRTTPLPP